MAHGFTIPEREYPADHGVRMRMMAMPVDRPGEPLDKPRATRRNEDGRGEDCDVLATLGARPREPVSPDDRVHDWQPVTR